MKEFCKNVLKWARVDINKFIESVSSWSIRKAVSQNQYSGLISRLREVVPDISKQESRESKYFNSYYELKRRALQAFQSKLMLRMVELIGKKDLTVVDIGDSAGTHMIYLKSLIPQNIKIDTVSVNLDQRAIDKIKARGLKAILCRAEDLNLGHQKISFFTSFEMVEHLHNPAIFFKRLAKRSECGKLVITVPFVRNSRVGMYSIRKDLKQVVYAEDEHIFELSPRDWELLMLHSGWKIVESQTYYQYPKKWPIISWMLEWFWRETDFEGFWGVILERDTTYCDLYQDWEDNQEAIQNV